MKIKICGITSLDDARFCATFGLDFIGLVFVPGSPRFVDPGTARLISDEVRALSPRTRVVGVFQDAPFGVMRRTAEQAGLDYVQLHGSEPPEIADAIELPVIKAFVPGVVPDDWSAAAWFLFDHANGGTGRSVDWSLIPPVSSRPFFLAGGLSPLNVLDAIARVRPDGVDISSGVEKSPGRKDHALVACFVEKVRSL